MTGEREEKQKQTKWHSGSRSAWNKTFFDGFSDVKEGPY